MTQKYSILPKQTKKNENVLFFLIFFFKTHHSPESEAARYPDGQPTRSHTH